MKNKKGFTLIELLVVVAIIGLLSAIVLVSLNSARKASNDAKRKADLKQMANAQEMYYDLYNVYPTSPAGDTCSTSGVSPACTGTSFGPTVTPFADLTSWMAVPPVDPLNNTTNYYRIKANVGTTSQFCIIAAALQNTTAAYYVAHNGAGTTTTAASRCPSGL